MNEMKNEAETAEVAVPDEREFEVWWTDSPEMNEFLSQNEIDDSWNVQSLFFAAAYIAWKASRAALAATPVQSVVLPEPDAYMDSEDAHRVGTSSDWVVTGDMRAPDDVALYTASTVRALLATATGLPAQAVARIVHLRADRKQRIYVAGPMTGLPEFNFPAFNSAADKLRSEGWHVENPAEHGHIDGADWADYLRWDISRIATCGAIYLLPGWEGSKGATLEVSIGKALGMEFILAPGAAPEAQADARDAVERGEVLVTVSGFTGSGKSAIAGEIEILCRALGLQVEWPDGDSEKNMTHADWTAALELYKPRVRIVENNIPHTTKEGNAA